jgi:orotidine-5'-phosphate decarboxylase
VGYCPEGRAPLKLWRLAEDRGSRLILALDVIDGSPFKWGDRSLLDRCFRLLDSLREYIVGVKIGFPLLLSIGVSGVREIIADFKEEFYFLSDFKIGDIPEIATYTVSSLQDLGFDGATIHLFQGGLTRITRDSIDLFGVLMMSHPEAILFEKNFNELINEALKARVDGVIVGATKKEYIQEARKKIPQKTILCPGIITQGAEPSQALKYGGDFEIIGRAITASTDPILSTRKILEVERGVLQR